MWIFFQNLKKQIVIVVLKREHSTIDCRHRHLREISQLYYITLFNVRDWIHESLTITIESKNTLSLSLKAITKV